MVGGPLRYSNQASGGGGLSDERGQHALGINRMWVKRGPGTKQMVFIYIYMAVYIYIYTYTYMCWRVSWRSPCFGLPTLSGPPPSVSQCSTLKSQ